MNQFILFLHVLGAIGMGFYLLLPLFLRVKILENRPVLHVFYWLNFTVQWILVAQFLTGIYLIYIGNYSLLWIVLVAIVFTGIGAFGGMFGYYIRKFLKTNDAMEGHWLKKIRFHGLLTSICMFFIVILMLYPQIG